MSRWVTFYYNAIDERVIDFKVHPDKETALKYFNQNHRRFFETNIRFKADQPAPRYANAKYVQQAIINSYTDAIDTVKKHLQGVEEC